MREVVIIIPSVPSEINRNLVKEIIKNIRETTPNIYEVKVYLNNWEGNTASLNKGLKYAQSVQKDVVVMCDDMRWKDNEWLQKFQNKADEDKDIFIVSTLVGNRDLNNKNFKYANWGMCYIPIKTINEIGLLDENLVNWGNEVDYGIRILKHNKKMIYCDIIGKEHLRIDKTFEEGNGWTDMERIKKEAIDYERKKWKDF